MAFRLKKDKKSKNKSRLLKRLKELEAKKSLTMDDVKTFPKEHWLIRLWKNIFLQC